VQQRIVAARRAFAANLPENLRDSVEFFDPERYNAAARIDENIMFGTICGNEVDDCERVERAIGGVLEELGLRGRIVAIGLDYPVGTGGLRLSPAQRQKVAIARAVLKRPVLLALDEATAVLDPASEMQMLDGLRREFAGRSVLATLSRPGAARGFDNVLILEHGHVVKEGPYDSLSGEDGPLAPLMAAE
jgi:ABC-type multidrug transport system fused ATPase/permease subunit